MKNKELKQQLIQNDTHKKYSNRKFELYKAGVVDEARERVLSDEFGDEEAKALKQLEDARRKQKKRIREHLEYWISRGQRIFFLTFTISEENKKRLSENCYQDQYLKAFKDYCTRSMSHCEDYIINLDFGDETEREHYHALVTYKVGHCTMKYNGHINRKSHRKEYEDINIKYNLGNLIAEEFEYDIDPAGGNKLAAYITKLVTHSLKVKQSYVSTKKESSYRVYQSMQKILSKKISDRTKDENAEINRAYCNNIRENYDKPLTYFDNNPQLHYLYDLKYPSNNPYYIPTFREMKRSRALIDFIRIIVRLCPCFYSAPELAHIVIIRYLLSDQMI